MMTEVYATFIGPLMISELTVNRLQVCSFRLVAVNSF